MVDDVYIVVACFWRNTFVCTDWYSRTPAGGPVGSSSILSGHALLAKPNVWDSGLSAALFVSLKFDGS
jgi:hypothetical protein